MDPARPHAMRPTVTLCLLAPALVAPASAQFAGARILPDLAAPGAFDSLSVDLDGDGWLDVLVGAAAEDSLVWFRSVQGSGFEPARVLDVGLEGIGAIGALDLDGDGVLEPIAFSRGRVVGYDRLAPGRFGGRRVLAPVISGAVDFDHGDLDGDGDEDLVLVDQSGSGIWRIDGTPAGWLQSAPLQLATLQGVHRVQCVDLDGDQDLDVLAYSGQSILALENPGHAGAWPSLDLDAQGFSEVSHVGTCDFNQDGVEDVLVHGVRGSVRRQWILMSTAAGGHLAEALAVPLAGPGAPQDIAAADFDGDGDVDLAMALGSPVLFENLGGGTTLGVMTSLTTLSSSVEAADLDRDGVADLVSTSPLNDAAVQVAWSRPALAPDIWTETEALDGSVSVFPISIALIDSDGDGGRDVLVLSGNPYDGTGPGQDSLSIFKDDHHGWYERGALLPGGPADARHVESFDLDGDGLDDILTAGRFVTWYRSLGGGHFDAPVTLDTGGMQAYHATAADVDGDGTLDVVATVGWQGIGWFRGLGGGGFAPHALLPGTGLSFGVDAADIDGDGDVDVAYSTAPGRADWSENLGAGTFASPVTLVGVNEYFPAARQVLLRDLDRDGIVDVVASAFTRTYYLHGLGGGVFATPQRVASFPAGVDYQVVAVGDLDGDGLEDIVLSGRDQVDVEHDPVQWARNLGSGQFGPPTSIASPSLWPHAIAAYDQDADGDDDLLLGGFSDKLIVMIESLASGAGARRSVGAPFCGPAEVNSTGAAASLLASGSDRVVENDLRLLATGLPPQAFGLFVGSREQGFTPAVGGGQGALCLGAPLARFLDSIQAADGDGRMQHDVNLMAMPLGATPVAVMAGESWSFQAWFRDAAPSATSNLSAGVVVYFE